MTATESGRAGEAERAIAKNLARTGPANQAELDRILKLRHLGGMAPGSDQNLSLVIRRADNFLNKPLGSMTAAQATAVMTHLKSLPGRHGKPAKPKVVHMRSVLLRAYLKETLGIPSNEKLPRDLDRATYVPKPKDPEESGVALTDPQFRRLLDAAIRLFRGKDAARKAMEMATLFWVKADGGPRIGELLSLNVEEAELRGGMAGLLHARESRRGHRLKRGPRTIPITFSAGPLKLWLSKHPAANDPNAPLFPAFTDPTGRQGLDYSVFYKLFRKAAVLSGIDAELPPGVKLRPHDLRHTAATNDAAAGDAALRKKYGWSKGSSMPGHYTNHLTTDRVLVQMQELTAKRFGVSIAPTGAAHLPPQPTPPSSATAPPAPANADALADGVLDALMNRLAARAKTPVAI